jgi:3-isopropylmalate dehydrogenase
MMLDYINEKNTADKIRKAVAETILDGQTRTYDMMKMTGSPEVVKNGAASTIQMTDTIISRIR